MWYNIDRDKRERKNSYLMSKEIPPLFSSLVSNFIYGGYSDEL